MSRRAVLLAVVAFIAATAGGVTAPALAAESCDGVWVVVDARTAGGSLTTRCTPGDPGSGIRALTGAGHDVAYVQSQPGLVCTIDARPDPCNGAPSDAYWSYWYASAGGSWTYSNLGAGSRDPAPGTVEGWRFGDGSAPPGTAPPSNEAPEPDPEPVPEPTPEPEPEPAPAPRTEPRSSSSGAASSNDPATGGAAASAAEDSERASETPDLQGADEPEPATTSSSDDPDADDPNDEDPTNKPDGDENDTNEDEGDASDTTESGGDASDPDPSENAGPDPDADATDRGGDALEASDPETLDGTAAGQDSALAGSNGSPWGLILAVALVGAIGGTTLYRRRQPRQPRREVG